LATISELINQMLLEALESAEWTSANPTHINTLIQVNAVSNPDFESKIRQLLKEFPDKEDNKFQTPKEEKTDFGDITKLNKQPVDKKDAGLDDISKKLSGMSKDDAMGIFKKAGLDPKNLPGLLALSSGKGGLGLLTSVGGAAGLAPLLGPVALGLAIQPLTEAIIKELQRPGGFLDKRVKIDARNESFAELDRQTRQNTRIGDRQVIIQQFEGFRNFDGFASTNTSSLIRENADRVLDIGLFDRAQGIPMGGK